MKKPTGGAVTDAAAAASDAVPPEGMEFDDGPDESGNIEKGGVDPRQSPRSGPQVDGIEFAPDAAAEFKVVGDARFKIPSRPVPYRAFHVWGLRGGRYLGKVKSAVDESDAISQMITAYKAKAPEQYMWRAEAVEGVPPVIKQPEEFRE